MMFAKRFTVGLIAALTTAAALAACGSSTPSSHQAATHSQSGVTVTNTGSAPGGPSATGTTGHNAATNGAKSTTGTTTGPTGTAACVAADLKPAFLGTNGAAGTIAIGFALTNTSGAPCHTYGWPGVQLESRAGAPLPTNATRSTSDPIGSTPVSEIVLRPGEQVSFRMLMSDFAQNGGANCPNASQLQIIAPDDTATLSVRIGGGIPACGKGTLSPLVTGAGAWPKQ